MRERAYLVFQKYQKPLHFREVTQLINKHFNLKKPAIPETVCNVVIHFNEFVAVEYGIYALVEWNLFDDKIKNEIIKFLKQQSNRHINQNKVFVCLDDIVEYIQQKFGKNLNVFVIQANLFD